MPHAGGAGGIGYARRAATGAHHGIETIALFLEIRQHRSFKRAAAGQLDADRIDEASVDQNFVVNVGARRLSGRTDKADYLTLPHPLAHLRAFVLIPWLAVDPDAALTVAGGKQSVAKLLAELDVADRSGVRRTDVVLEPRAPES